MFILLNYVFDLIKEVLTSMLQRNKLGGDLLKVMKIVCKDKNRKGI